MGSTQSTWVFPVLVPVLVPVPVPVLCSGVCSCSCSLFRILFLFLFVVPDFVLVPVSCSSVPVRVPVLVPVPVLCSCSCSFSCSCSCSLFAIQEWKSATNIRKMLEISGICEKISFFISFFHSCPYMKLAGREPSPRVVARAAADPGARGEPPAGPP